MPEHFYQLFFDDEPVDDDFYAKVIEIEVENNADRADAFRLKLGIRLQDDGEWSELSLSQFSIFTKVRIESGFTGGGTDILTEGYITEVNHHFEDPARQPYLEIRGLDSCVLMSLEEKIVSWPNLSDGDIATQILSDYGFTPDVTSTQPVHQENDTTVIQRGTDLHFLRHLARKNGFEVGVEKDFTSGQLTGYFRPPNLDGSPQGTLAVAFGNNSSLSSLEVQVDGLRPLAVEVGQIDVKAKEQNSATGTDLQLVPIGEQDLSTLVSSRVGSLVTARDTVGKLWLHTDPTADSTEMTTMAQAVRDEAGWLVTARGEINSEVYGRVLRTNRLVQIRGAGSISSGKYYVTRVVHKINGNGEYNQSFEARRNAIGLDGSEDFSDAEQ